MQKTARYELILKLLTILFTPRAQQALWGGSWGQTVRCAPTKHLKRHLLRIGTHQAMVSDP